MTIRLLIADDHRLFTEAMAFRLSRGFGLEVVGEASDGRSAIDLAVELRPDVISMDVCMPKLNGIDATYRILKEVPETRVIILAEMINVRCVRRAIEAGAHGYLSKCCSLDELVAAIRHVASGHTYFSSHVRGILLREFASDPGQGSAPGHEDLTSREREIIQLVAEGNTTAKIAEQLSLSDKTIAARRKKAMQKLGVQSVSGLVRYAIDEGLVSHTPQP